MHQQTKKIVGNNSEQTTVPHIFAIGDVLQVFDKTQIIMEKLVPSVFHLRYDKRTGRGDTLGTRLIRQEQQSRCLFISKVLSSFEFRDNRLLYL